MKTSKLQTSLFGEDSATFLQVVSHASRGQQPENEKEKKMNATYGRTCLEQFKRFPRAGLWAKTFAGLLIGMEGWYSTRCKLTWKLRATKSSRFYFQLQVSTRRMKGIEYGLLPTSRANDAQKRGQISDDPRNGLPGMAVNGLLPTPDAGLANGGKINKDTTTITGKSVEGQKRQISLNDYMQRGFLPTPVVLDSGATTSIDKLDARCKKMKAKHNGKNGTKYSGNGFGVTLGELVQRGMLPTPRASQNENRQTKLTPSQMAGKHGLNLAAVVNTIEQTGNTSQLSPQFVLEMMGFPPDWCLLPFQESEAAEL